EKSIFHHIYRHKKNNSASGLELKGRVQDNFGTMGTVNITVYVDSTCFLTTTSNRSGKCKFTLPLNSQYTVVFSLPGYVSKKIRVNTKVPSSRMALYTFHFTIDLFEEIKDLD